jgi:hypothetical protein
MTYIVDLLIQNWKEEQASKPLQALTATFTASVKEIEMVKYLWNDLLKIRKHKLDAAVAGGVPVNEECLLDFEVEYFRSLRGMAFKYDGGRDIFPDTRANRELSSNYLTVRLVQDAGELVGLDLRTYGPFKKEDIVYMPKEHAEILINDGKAKRVIVSS